MQRIRQELESDQSIRDLGQIEVIEHVKCSQLPELSRKESLSECVGNLFGKADVLIFVCAAGIAVRSIAPYIGHKSEDPAVIVLDELGTFCISLLSGHAGGANEWTERIADMIGAVPVITTATDREKRFSVDDFARKNHLLVTDWTLAKEISVDVLAGKRIIIYTELPIEGMVPRECEVNVLKKADDMAEDIGKKALQQECCAQNRKKSTVIISSKEVGGHALQLIPKNIVIGIGCRKETSEEKIASAVKQCLKQEQIDVRAVAAVASIDLKKEEKGLVDFCKRLSVPFLTYTAEELGKAEGSFAVSAFVEKVTGVSCVCERSAVVAAKGSLLCHKKVFDGVTVAVARKNQIITFNRSK